MNTLLGKVYGKSGMVFNINAFGAKGDAIQGTCTITGLNTLTATASLFKATDVGKEIYIYGVAAGGHIHKTTIATYSSPTVVTLTASTNSNQSSVTFFFGTNNTTAIQNAINAADIMGGGRVTGASGNYIITNISLKKRIDFVGTGLDAFQLWSANETGKIIDSTWPINSSTAVNIGLRRMTIRALHSRNKVAGFGEICGTYVNVEEVRFKDSLYGIVFDQTEVSYISKCIFETTSATYMGGILGTSTAENTGWTKTGTGTTSASDGYVNISGTGGTATFFSKAAGADIYDKGFTARMNPPNITSGTPQFAVDAGTGNKRYVLQYELDTGVIKVRINGGTLRTCSNGLTSVVSLITPNDGATADLWIDNVKVDSAVAGIATAASAGVYFGDILTTNDSVSGWKWMEYFSYSPIPACLWMVNGPDYTVGANAEFTNRITVEDCQFNTSGIQIADDGGYCHYYRGNNFNSGFYQVHLCGLNSGKISENEMEGCIFSPFKVWNVPLNRSIAIATNIAVEVSDNLITKGSPGGIYADLPLMDLLNSYSFKLSNNYWVRGSGYCIRVDTSGAVAVVDADGDLTSGASLFSSTSSSYPYIRSKSGMNNTTHESLIYRLGTKTLSLRALTTAQITADQNNYNPTKDIHGTDTHQLIGSILRLSTDASRNITGLIAGLDGQVVTIYNVGSFNIVLVHESASSTAANRFLSSTAANVTLTPNQKAELWYDSTTQRWRLN